MLTQQRIENLEKHCQQRQDNLQKLFDRKDRLLSEHKNGLFIFKNGSENILPVLIKEVDEEILQSQKILIKMESLRDSAISGQGI